MVDNLTVIYYTANFGKESFFENTRKLLLDAIGDTPLISVSQKSMNFGKNICIGEIGRSHTNIYWQALIGAKEATTKYIALAEDDILYTLQHFRHIPSPDIFAYNMNVASIYSWVNPPIFSFKDRRVLHSLVCERELFIRAMEERFAKYPMGKGANLSDWAEPGRDKLEKYLGVTQNKSERFHTTISNIAFCTEESLAFLNLGKRKRIGNRPTVELPYWGTSEGILKLYTT